MVKDVEFLDLAFRNQVDHEHSYRYIVEKEKIPLKVTHKVEPNNFYREFICWNEKTITDLASHLSKSEAWLVLLLNTLMPGFGTIMTACMLKKEKLEEECKLGA